jgi:hypothetical protein
VRKFVVTFLPIMLLAAFGFVLVHRAPLPPRTLEFRIEPAGPSDPATATHSVTISNKSDFRLGFRSGVHQPWFQIAFLVGEEWHTSQVHTFENGDMFLEPHSTDKGTICVPKEASKARVGLWVTSLTWRARCAKWLAGTRVSNVLRPAIGFLWKLDNCHTTQEWSDAIRLGNQNRSGISQ